MKKRKRISAVITSIMTAAVMLFGSAGAAVADDAAAEGEKHLNMAIYWFGDDLDPGHGWNGWTLTRAAVGENLVTVTEDLELVGQLADSWEAVDDTTWKFHIRQGVTFQNGNPLTAEAVKSSIERSIEINERGQTNLKLSSIETDGEYVIFQTEEPYGAFLANLSEPLFIIVDTTADTDTFVDTPVCTGPYMVTSFDPGVSFEAVAYKDYWGGTPGLDSVTVYNIEDDNTRAMTLQAGNIDMMQRVTATDLTLFENNPDYTVQSTIGTREQFLFMNTEKAPFDDETFRLAFNAGIDYDAVANVVGGGAVATGAPFPPTAPCGYDELSKASFDPDLCASLLEEAGYTDSDGDGYVDKDGEPLEISVTVNNNADDYSMLAELVQAQMKDRGIKLVINQVENAEDDRADGNFQLLFGNWQTVSTGDTQWFLDQVFRSDATDNYGKYNDPELDEVIGKLSTAFELDEREELTKQASQIIIDRGFGCYLVSPTNINIARSNVSNMHTFPIDYYFLTADTTIE